MYKTAKNIILTGGIFLLSYHNGVAQVIPKDSIPKALNYIAQVANIDFLHNLSTSYKGRDKKNVDTVIQMLGNPVLTTLITRDSLEALMTQYDLKSAFKKVAFVVYNLDYQNDLNVDDLIKNIDIKLKNVKGLKIENYSASLINGLAPLINKENEGDVVVVLAEDEGEDDQNVEEGNKRRGVIESALSFLFTWGIRGLALVGLILGFKLIKKNLRRTNKLIDEEDSHKTPSQKSESDLVIEELRPNRADKNVQEYNSLRTEVATLKKELGKAKMEIEQFQGSVAPLVGATVIETTDVPIMDTQKMEEIVHKNLYFASPNGDGSFPVSNQDDNLDDSFHNYRLTKKASNANHATIDFINNALFSNILSTPHQYIDPVFTQENVPTAATKKIRVINPGLWELKGDKWELQSKATIIYE